jgi:outer membrane biosynthesis protein TonB
MTLTLESFLQVIESHPWTCIWVAIFLLFALVVVRHLGSIVLAMVVLAVVLVAAPWKKSTATSVPDPTRFEVVEPQPQPPLESQPQTEQAEPVEPVAPTPEQAPLPQTQTRPSPYGEPQESVQGTPAAVL